MLSNVKTPLLFTRSIRPLKLMSFVQAYLFCALFLYFFGPVKWRTHNGTITFILILAYQSALALGYWLGIRTRTVKADGKMLRKDVILRHFPMILLASIALDLFLFIRRASIVQGAGGIGALLGLSNYGSLYHAYHNDISLTSSGLFGGRVLAAMIPLLGPISSAALPLAFVYYRDLSRMAKALSILAVLMRFFSNVPSGATEGIFDIAISMIAAFMINAAYAKKVRARSRKTALVVVLICVLLVYVFSAVMIDRTGGTYNLTLGGNVIEAHEGLISLLPDMMKLPLIYLSAYLCQGYYGFSLTTTLPWKPTFGIGYSYYLRENVQELLPINVTAMSYQGRAEVYGWGANSNWHSVYTWFANDIGIFGVVILMVFIGWLLAEVYKDCLLNKNPIGISLFSLLVLFVLYIPANNRVFANPQTFTAFWFHLLAWLIRRRRAMAV